MGKEHIDGREHDPGNATARSTPLLEWIAAGIGLILVVSLSGVIGWQALNEDDAPALIAEIGAITQVEGGYRAELRARNMSTAAAAQVEVEGRLTVASQGEVETGRVLFDYVAGHSVRKGGLFFTRDPRSGSLSIRVAAYAIP